MPIEAVVSIKMNILLSEKAISLIRSPMCTLFRFIILFAVFKSKKYIDWSFKEATTYFRLPKPIILPIPIEGTKYFNGSIKPLSLCDL